MNYIVKGLLLETENETVVITGNGDIYGKVHFELSFKHWSKASADDFTGATFVAPVSLVSNAHGRWDMDSVHITLDGLNTRRERLDAQKSLKPDSLAQKSQGSYLRIAQARKSGCLASLI